MTQTPAPHPLLNLPNVISFARLCAVPAAIYLVIDADWRAAIEGHPQFAGLGGGLEGLLIGRID